MKMKLPEYFSSVLLIIWIVFSVGYIAIDAWGDFQVAQLNQNLRAAYQTGYTDSVAQVITEAQKCEGALEVFAGETRIQLVNPACAQAPVAEAPADAGAEVVPQ